MGIKNAGVPEGTRWASKLLYWYSTEINIEPNHKGKDRAKVITRCLVLVKMYGIKPIKLEKSRKKKTLK